MATQGLSICLLGNVQFTHNQHPVAGLNKESLQALVAYLLMHAKTPQLRSHIASVCWPELSEGEAKAKLRRELYQLRQELPEANQYLTVTAKTLQWRPQLPFWSDVMEFEDAISQAQIDRPHRQIESLKKAVDLYKGPLLPNCYDEWLLTERDRLQQVMIDALTDLCQLLSQQQDYRDAIAYGQRLIQLDPLLETGYLFLMKLYAQQGDRATALQKYHQCMSVLREELGVDPSPDTRQFYEQLLLEKTAPVPPAAAAPAAAGSPTGSPPEAQTDTYADWGEAPDISFFHGRSAEMQQLQTWLTHDRSRLIAVLGMGGIGKTTLAAKVAHDLKQDFEYVIWRSLRNAPPLDALLSDLIPFLSQQQDMDYSVLRLIHWLRQSRCLVILDNVESILKKDDRAGQFRDGYQAYSEFLMVVGQTNHQSCLVLTSREKPAEIATFEGTTSAVQSLSLKGSHEAALALLEAKQLTGTAAEKELLCQRYSCSPLALQIVGSSIRDIFSGEIALFLKEETFLFNGAKRLLDHQFERLIPLEQTIMYWLAINRDWTRVAELAADIYPPQSKIKLLEALESLCWRSLIERRGNAYTQQPVVMEYVTLNLIEAAATEFAQWTTTSAQPLTHLSQFALTKIQARDYIHDAQIRLILQPFAQELRLTLPAVPQIEQQGKTLIQFLQSSPAEPAGYICGNLVNLLRHLKTDLSSYNFSGLPVWQANLQGIPLRHTNFSDSDLANSRFTQTLSSVTSLAFNPTGDVLATGDTACEIRLWTIQGQVLLTLRGHQSWVFGLAFSPDGQTIISGSVDSTLRLWDATTGDCLRVVTGHQGIVFAVAFSAQGHWIASCSDDQTVKIWDVNTGQCLQTFQGGGRVRSVTFGQDDTILIAICNDQTIQIWDLSSGKVVQSLSGHADLVWSVALSPSGQYLASGSHDQTIRVWDRETGDCLNTLRGHTDQVWTVCFAVSGRRIVSGSIDRTVKVWDVSTGRCLWTLRGHTDQVWTVAAHPTAPLIASAASDQTVRLWNLDAGKCEQTWQGYANQLHTLAFSPQGDLLACGGDDGIIRLWDWAQGRLLHSLEGHHNRVHALSFQPRGSRLASGDFDQTIRVWELQTFSCQQQLRGDNPLTHTLTYHPDGRRLATSSALPTIFIWDSETETCLQKLVGHTDSVWSVAFSPDGSQLVSVSGDQTVKLWDVETGVCVRTLVGHCDLLSGVVTLKRPDARPQGPVAHPDSDHQVGYWIASVGADQVIKVWDSQTGDCLQTLEGHTSWIFAIAAHPSGHSLASASHDGTVRLWDVCTGQCFGILSHDSQLSSVAYHPQGEILACCGFGDSITIWDLKTQTLRQHLETPKPYHGMKIGGVTGLTDTQRQMLQGLGAVG